MSRWLPSIKTVVSLRDANSDMVAPALTFSTTWAGVSAERKLLFSAACRDDRAGRCWRWPQGLPPVW